MQVLSTRNKWWMAECEAALLAEGIDYRFDEQNGAYVLKVADVDISKVIELLSDLFAQQLEKNPTLEAKGYATLFVHPPFVLGLMCALLMLAIFVAMVWDPQLFDKGAMIRSRFLAGDYFRLLTAATLHADVHHVLSNAAFFLILGWSAAERVGTGISLLFWTITAVCGFAASLLFSEIAFTVGASGGLFGLLGVAAGHGLKEKRYEVFWSRRIRTFGAGVLLFAMTGFGEHVNVWAHAGGFFSGVVCGILSPRRIPGAAWQIGGGLLTLFLFFIGWQMALTK